jgi:hypothetical protein
MRGTRTWIRLATGGLVAAAMLAIPTTAFADKPTVTPIVDCVAPAANGTFVAVFGYNNTASSTVTLTKDGGPNNSISPANLDGAQPDKFDPGTSDAVFKLTIPTGGSATWTLHGGRSVVASASSPSCGPPAPLPQDGNGLGMSIVMILAVAWGLWMVLRSSRKRKSLTPRCPVS